MLRDLYLVERWSRFSLKSKDQPFPVLFQCLVGGWLRQSGFYEASEIMGSAKKYYLPLRSFIKRRVREQQSLKKWKVCYWASQHKENKCYILNGFWSYCVSLHFSFIFISTNNCNGTTKTWISRIMWHMLN